MRSEIQNFDADYSRPLCNTKQSIPYNVSHMRAVTMGVVLRGRRRYVRSRVRAASKIRVVRIDARVEDVRFCESLSQQSLGWFECSLLSWFGGRTITVNLSVSVGNMSVIRVKRCALKV